MATIKSTLGLNDVMTPTLRKINRAMGMVLDTFEAVQEASGQTFNSASIAVARQEIGQANSLLDAMEEDYKNINKQQNRLNDAIGKGTSAAGGFLNKIKGIGAAFLGMKGVSWIKESLGLSDIQRNAERQLTNVLNNTGAEKGSFEMLTAKASALQGHTNYGDEALIGGAAEFSTYMQDSDAVAVMMETLTNYAAGMSGGGEVGYEEMVQYATNLGKITTGSFDAMTKKGFEFTDAQKKIIENGTDMEKALTISEVINESWAGLANSMANTPQGKIIQLKNAFGDMREELGARIYPAVMQLFDTISANSASISGFITGLAKPVNLVINVLNKTVKAASAVYNFFARNWSKIGPIVGGIVTAVAAYNAALLAHKAYLAGAAVVQGIKTVAEYRHAKAIMAAVAAMGSEATAAELEAAGLGAETVAKASATVAQTSFNTALWACPITWIIVGLLVLVAALGIYTNCVNDAYGLSLSFAGMLGGFLVGTLAVLGNVVIGAANNFIMCFDNIWNTVAAFANFFANVFNNPVGAVWKLWEDLFTNAVDIILNVTKLIDSLFNTNWSEQLTNFRDDIVGKVRDKYGDEMDKNITVMERRSDYLDYINVDDAFNFGYDWGDSLWSGFNPNMGGIYDALGYEGILDNIANDTSDIVDSGSKTSEELAYLRDIAEQEAINRFTTAEIKVDFTSHNTISSDTDVDGIIEQFEREISEAVETAAEGDY